MAATIIRELAAKFGIDFDTKGIGEGAKKLDDLVGKVQNLAIVVGASMIAQRIGEFAVSIADLGADLHNTARAFGMSETAFASWQAAAASVGVQGDQLRAVLGAVARNVAAAGNAASPQAKAFRDLGISLRDAEGNLRSTDDLLAETGAKIAALPDETQRTATAMALMGEQGARLLPLFERGAGGVEAIREEMRALYGDDLEAIGREGVRFRAEMAKWSNGFQSLQVRLGVWLLPKLSALSEALVGGFRAFQQATRGTHVLELAGAALGVVLGVLAVKAAAAGVALLAPWLPAIGVGLLIAAGIGAIILLVDDLIAMFSGEQSVIAEFLDEMLGAGTAEIVVRDLTAAWVELTESIKQLPDALAYVYEAAVAWTEGVIARVMGMVDGIGAAWTTAKTAALAFWEILTSTVAGAFARMTGFGEAFFSKIASGWESIRSTVGRLAAAFGIEISGPGATTRPAAVPAAAAPVVSAAAAGVARTANVQQTTTINVQGTADPEQTAALVTERLAAQRAEEHRNLRRALVPMVD